MCAALLVALAAAPSHAAPREKRRVARCHSGSLSVGLRTYNGAAGNEFFLLVLRNRGTRACTLHGYPGVSMLNAKRHQVGAAATRAKGRSPRFTVRPGRAGSATLTERNPTYCRPPHTSRYLRVYPPNERRAILKRARLVGCKLAIYPLQPGTRPPSEHR